MEMIIKGLASTYQVEHVVRIFYPEARIKSYNLKDVKNTPCIYARLGQFKLCAGIRLQSEKYIIKIEKINPNISLKEKQLKLCSLIYGILSEETGLNPPWGMLTGVRPVRFLRNLEIVNGKEKAQEILTKTYKISNEKLRLISKIGKVQKPVISNLNEKDYSLYISIPFCPSRCSYCSFVSRSLERDAKLTAPYVEKLCKELEIISKSAAGLSLNLKSIYIGGGTPSSLSLPEINTLLECIEKNFSTSSLKEYSFEAGRPDCTTMDKIELVKSYGVNRISINPQSMNDNVLQAIGRKHTAEDVEICYAMARKAGFDFINMDLIAGLPEETQQSFENSVEKILNLNPENITLHSLTAKRASNLVIDNGIFSANPVKMLDYAYKVFANRGFMPYYLYRQKNTPGNLENTGWCKAGYESYYNINIMEECQSILAAGAGGATKIVVQEDAGKVQIRRFFNHKYPLEYLADFDIAMKEKYEGVKQLYAGYMDT